MTDQAHKEVVVPVNPNVGTTTSIVKDLVRMSPPQFHGSKVEEHPPEFINEVYKVISIIGVTPVEKVKLVSYQLKGVDKVW